MTTRETFITEVARTIHMNHGREENSSFIFGISGRWGEGKSLFLSELKVKLEKMSGENEITYKIIDVNPWKFSTDKTAFLRAFVTKLRPKVGFWHKLLDWINNRAPGDVLYTDVSFNKVHAGYLLAVLIYALDLMLLYYSPFHNQILGAITFVKPILPILVALLLPAMLGLFGKILTNQRSVKAIANIDAFDRELDRALPSGTDERIVVFVDDLDRVLPDSAREMLDILRTFFDRPELTFVVTADHSVLERYIGAQASGSDASPSEKIEEGRRYLKKIFNVYWRLPLPINKEFMDFLDKTIQKRNEFWSDYFKPAELTTLKLYLEKYFEKNYRQVLRFLDSLEFTFRIIGARLDDDDPTKQGYFQDCKDYPLLVVRTLMIQDLCTPLFEEILRDSKLLWKIEYEATINSTATLDELASPDSNVQLSPSQYDFIKKFVLEPERFYDGLSLRVQTLDTFLYLTADKSFGDERGPSPQDFVNAVTGSTPEQINNLLVNSGIKNIKGDAAAVKTLISAEAPPTKAQRVHVVISSLLMTPEHGSNSIFLEALEPIGFDYIAQLGQDERLSIIGRYLEWLDSQASVAPESPYRNLKDILTRQDVSDLNLDRYGAFSTELVLDWLVAHHNENSADAVQLIALKLAKLDYSTAESKLSELAGQVAKELVTDATPERRDYRLTILMHNEAGKAALRPELRSAIVGRNEALWNWAVQKIASENGDWSLSDLQDFCLESITISGSNEELQSNLIFAATKLTGREASMWDGILANQTTTLIAAFPQIATDSSLTQLAPPAEQTRPLWDTVVNHIESLPLEQQANWIQYLQPSVWIWSNIPRMPAFGGLKKLSRSRDSEHEEALKSLKAAWQSRLQT